MNSQEFISRRLSVLVSTVFRRKGPGGVLAALAEDIARKGPSWYSPWSNEVSPAYGKILSRLQALLAKPARLLGRLDDRLYALRAQEALLGSALRHRGLDLSSFGIDSLRAAAAKAGDDSPKALDALFSARLEAFKSPECALAVSGWRRLLRLAALCRFDFEHALARVAKGPKHWKKADAPSVARDLDDLRFLVEGFSCDDSAFLALSVIAEMEKAGTKEIQGLRENLLGVATLLGGPLAPDRLAAVLRTSAKNTALKLKAWKEEPDFRKPIVDSLVSEYGKARRDHADRQASERYEALRRRLFGEAGLLAVELYDEERARLFGSKGLPGFRHVLALSVVKSFVRFRYENLVRGPVATLLTVLECSSGDFEESLGSAFAACGDFVRRLSDFEHDLLSPDRSLLPGAIKFLTGGSPDLVAKRRAAKAALDTDNRAEALVSEAQAAASSLHGCLARLLADLKSPDPALAANGRALVAAQAPLLKSLDMARAALRAFVELLAALPSAPRPATTTVIEG